MNVGKTEVSTSITVSQLFVIQAEDVENRCVQIVHMHLVFDRRVTKFVRPTI